MQMATLRETRYSLCQARLPSSIVTFAEVDPSGGVQFQANEPLWDVFRATSDIGEVGTRNVGCHSFLQHLRVRVRPAVAVTGDLDRQWKKQR